MNVEDTRGVLTRPASVALVVLVGVMTLLVMGWKARSDFEAQAAQPAIRDQLEQIDARQREMQIDVAVIKAKVEALEKRGR